MLKAIEHRGDDGIFVNVSEQSINVIELTGGELTKEEISLINSTYPNTIPESYVPKILGQQQEPEDEPADQIEPISE